jgi:glucose/arabinose dehydrogenase
MVAPVLRTVPVALALTLAAAIAPPGVSAQTPAASRGPEQDWATEAGFTLEVDTEGFDFPTALAFVPDPGPDPEDPLYFVTELGGTVKVVTNDRSVFVFARDLFRPGDVSPLPAIDGETGLAGICLDPPTGYVFVTFAFPDSSGALRNNIVRLSSAPGTFAITAGEQVEFRDVFAGAEAAVSHQVGGCQIIERHLYVGVGDGLQPARSQDTTSVLGKVLRLTLEGEPVPTNRFYRPLEGLTRLERSGAFIWSWGFRNPFGLKAVDGTLFVAENGSNLDRFLEVRGGENYLWDGTDLSLGARADLAISPSIGPVQLDYVPLEAEASDFDGLRGDFFVATSTRARPGVMRIPYSVADARARAAPGFLVRYQGEGVQLVAGLAVGPDGLYFAPVLPDASGRTPILRVRAAADALAGAEAPRRPLVLIEEYGCLGCHRLRGEGGRVGPQLNRDPLRARLGARLGSAEHRELIATVDTLEREPFPAWREERAAILELAGHARQLRWVTAKILEPRFESPASEMPRIEMPRADAERIAAFLLGPDAPPEAVTGTRIGRTLTAVRARLRRPVGFRGLALIAGAAFLAGIAVTLTISWLARRRARRAPVRASVEPE